MRFHGNGRYIYIYIYVPLIFYKDRVREIGATANLHWRNVGGERLQRKSQVGKPRNISSDRRRI